MFLNTRVDMIFLSRSVFFNIAPFHTPVAGLKSHPGLNSPHVISPLKMVFGHHVAAITNFSHFSVKLQRFDTP